MKKVLLFAAIAFIAFNAQAQGFTKSIEVGGMFGLGTYKNKSADVAFVGGYSFGPKFFVGAGVGFRYTDALYYKSLNHGVSYTSKSAEYLIPIYARIKYCLTKKTVAPFIQGSVGYAINVGGKTRAVEGLYIEPAVGVDFNLRNKQAVYFSIGYSLQDSKYNYFYINDQNSHQDSHRDYAGAISVKVGFKF